MTAAQSAAELESSSSGRLATDVLLLVGFCGFFCFFGLAYFGLVGADEPRYAQVAREMLTRHDWITPTLWNQPWLEKPPLYYWQAMAAYRIFAVSDWAARLPSAVDATLMVVAVYLFLRRFRPGFQLDGALTTASSAGIIGFARAAATDMPLAAMFTIGMLAWYAWYESQSRKYLALSYLFLALAVLAKGPVAVLLAGLIILLFAVLNRDYASLRKTISIPGILVFCLIAFPWYVAVQIRSPGFFQIFILKHNLARFGTSLYHHVEPFWYFLPVLLIALLPWTLCVVARLLETFREFRSFRKAAPKNALTEDALSLYLAIWLILPVIFFSISQSKLPGYILPALPAGSLLVVEYIRSRSSEKLPRLLIVSHSILASFPIFPALMLQYILLQHRIPWGKAAAFSLGFAILVAIVISFALRAFGIRVLRTATLVPVVLTVAIVLRIGAPALDRALSSRPLANAISRFEPELRSSSGALPVAVFEAPRETEYGLGFYLNRPIPRYENHQIPTVDHIVIAPAGSQTVVAAAVPGRHVSYLGSFTAQSLDYFLVSEEP